MDGPRFIRVNGVDVALWERPGVEPAILLCHATGFHARSWNAIVDRLDGLRCIAPDMRGHGLSTKPALPIPWRDFGRDIAAVIRELGLRNAVGVGHSMGGHSVALAAALEPAAFSQLILLDPVIFAESIYVGPFEEPHFARKRRNRWASPQQMYQRFRPRAPFRSWDERVLRDYCEFGLLQAPDGDGFVLACPPEVEGAIYEQSRARDANIHPELARLEMPVLVARSRENFAREAVLEMNASPSDPELARKVVNGREVLLPYSHFIPMEAPGVVADLIRAAATRRDSAQAGTSPHR